MIGAALFLEHLPAVTVDPHRTVPDGRGQMDPLSPGELFRHLESDIHPGPDIDLQSLPAGYRLDSEGNGVLAFLDNAALKWTGETYPECNGKGLGLLPGKAVGGDRDAALGGQGQCRPFLAFDSFERSLDQPHRGLPGLI